MKCEDCYQDPMTCISSDCGEQEDSDSSEAAGSTALVGDLSLLVRRLAHQLEKANKNTDLPGKAMDYLRKNKLIHGPLRGEPNRQ